MTTRASRLRALILPLLLLCPAGAGAAGIVPLALPEPGAVVDRDLQLRRMHAIEAAAKARFAAKAATAKALTAGQTGWDVTFYDLALDLDPTADLLTGTVAMEATVTTAGLASLDLDLKDIMIVSAVRVAGAPAAWVHAGDLLTVTLDRAYAAGETVRVEVDYAGNPAGDYFGWASYGGQPLIWTLSEPFGAPWWWPCKDVTTDKADSVSLHVTVPDPLIVASNGVLEDQHAAGGGRTTFDWTTRHPIATYLVSVTAYPYAVDTDVYHTLDGGTMPVQNFVLPSWESVAVAGYAVVPDQIAAFAAAFGEYPFVDEKYGHAHFLWGGGMEHQTCASMVYSYYEPWFLAHELAHQWFGDAVTCADFHHIWLNEGFATWCEAYWREVTEGPAGYRAEMDAAAYYGAGTVYVPDLTDFNRIFDQDLSYNKGSWVVHMLRGVMGDAAFFAGLRQYVEQYAYGSADTEQFQAVMEAASGLDLGPFFQEWVYGEYTPTYVTSWTGTPAAGGTHVTVRIEQTQTLTGLFTMPLEIRLSDGQGGQTTVRVQNDQQVQWYTIDVPGPVATVELDPDHWVLCSRVDGGISDVAPSALPAFSRITGNAPNPFNPRTTIRYELAAAGDVRLDVYDLAGRRVRTLVAERQEAGRHAAVWDGRDDAGRPGATGVYLVRLRTAAGSDQRTVTLVK